MGYICDFCGDQRSMVYCRSDAACLCLSCDRNVHSANALSRRHSRTLLCERCNSQPAFVRCAEEKISLCQNCDWLVHGTSASSSTHKRQAINCYSGCPSAVELSSIWSFVLDIPHMSESTCEQELGLMSINENNNKSGWVPPENQDLSDSDQVTDLPALDKSLVCPSSMPESSLEPRILDQPAGPANECLPKLCCPATKCPALCEDENLYDDFNMDEVDLNLENYEELFGVALSHSEELFENGGIDSLFGTKDMSAGDSNCQDAVAAEGSSVGLVNTMQPACSNAASADSILSTKTEPILCFTGKQAQSNLSFSGITGESSAGDYQDCGASSMLLMGEPPWLTPCPENSLQSANRSNAVMRYKEKKKTRK
ncbi:zinc finger protein CONSTANS-LIKE 9-like isoform X2 [Abrus precatorius]|nr:zinc finger protein CONSTANS-LIKE 9-like isoform X2 [Abrus precatorius]